jgi:hypothetical protein
MAKLHPRASEQQEQAAIVARTMTKRRNKFGAVRTNGFASKKEERRYQELALLVFVGQIRDLMCQQSYPLTVNGIVVGKYTPDFLYVENGQEVVEEVKGGSATKTEAYRLRVRVFKACYPGIEHREI